MSNKCAIHALLSTLAVRVSLWGSSRTAGTRRWSFSKVVNGPGQVECRWQHKGLVGWDRSDVVGGTGRFWLSKRTGTSSSIVPKMPGGVPSKLQSHPPRSMSLMSLHRWPVDVQMGGPSKPPTYGSVPSLKALYMPCAAELVQQ